MTILTPFLAKRRHFAISATCRTYTYLWTAFRVFCRTKTLKKYFQHFWATLTTFLAKRHHITISAIGAQVRIFKYFVRLSLNFVGKYLEKMKSSQPYAVLTPFLAKRHHFAISATCRTYTYLWTNFHVFVEQKH